MNLQRVTLRVLLHLSVAFDTVDHGIFLRRLGRGQRNLCDGVKSDSFDLRFGVPQGICFGPLLFVVYASKLFEIIQAHLPDAHCSADDTQLYLSFKPNSPTGSGRGGGERHGNMH